jgi:hypothetical protein
MTDVDEIVELINEYGRCLFTAGTLNAMARADSCQTMKDEAGKAYDAILELLKADE